MAYIEVKNLKKDYKLGKSEVHALRGISFGIEKEQFIALAGPSGSGKSTALNLIGCLDKPTEGEIFIDGLKLTWKNEKELNHLRSKYIGFIFQSFNLISVLTVYENVELPLLIRTDISKTERDKRVRNFLERVGLGQYLKHHTDELSGGQRQRVAIARALATKPAFVLADEPTANLDSKTGVEIIELMHEINKKEGTTFLFSTHDQKIIDRADIVISIADGLIESIK